MTSALIDEIQAAPDEPAPVDDLFTDGALEAPRRTRPGRPRKPRIDPDTGEEIKTVRQPRMGVKMQEELLEGVVSVASDLSAIAPTVAGVLIARAESTVDGMMALAKGRPRTAAALRKVASVSKIAELLSIAGMLVFAAMVDFGRIPATHPLLDTIGYAEIVRDSNGKATKDDKGKIVKERTTLRDIRNAMVGESEEVQATDGLSMPVWNPADTVAPSTGTNKITIPPMNYNAAVPGMPGIG